MLVCLVLLVCALCFAACNNGNEGEHICSFGEWTAIKDATCTESGEQERACACGEKETRSVAALGHTEVVDEAVGKTCTSDGLTEGKHCSACGTVLVEQETIPSSHNWNEAYEYDKDGHWHTCTECDSISEKSAHDVGADGYCTVCDNPIRASDGLIYSVSEDGTYAEVTGYIGNSKRIVIAEEYEGLPVTHIANNAFENDGLTSIVIPDSVTSIGKSAFAYCSGLLQIENGIAYADKWVISCDRDATSVSLRSDTVGIADNAFEGCINLTSITLPDSVKIIGDSAFKLCRSLTSITIPDGVTSISDSTFSACTSLTSVDIPDSVTIIGDSAFLGCDGLTSIAIPDSVTSIGDSAFQSCDSLTNVDIPDSVTSIGDHAFAHCTSLTSIIIPNSVTSIGERAFLNCAKLTSIIIPDSVTSIGDFAFCSCTSLTSITIPDSITSISYGAFEY